LTRTIAREEEWKRCEAQNDIIEWGAEVTGWEATPPASPIPRVDVAGAGLWPGVTMVEQLAQAGTWPTEEEYLAKCLADCVQVKVSVEVHSSVGDLVEGHTACRSLISYSLPTRCLT
jgi:hypothetical protein